jgi:tripartite-type tricarboxylate transporter receptor subunit TctC
MRRNFNAIAVVTFGLLSFGQSTGFAQSAYPAKPITLIIPFPPGGSTDIVGRIVAEALSKQLGQPVIVDNKAGAGGALGAKAGAGGALGAKAIASANPDGYTLGLATVSTHVINPLVQPNAAKYDPIKDFTLISQIASIPNVVAVNPAVPAKSIKEFLSYAKANPGKLNYATPGSGSLGHLMGEAFKSDGKVFITHIPYRGAGPALNDVLAGQVQVLFDNLPSSLPHIQSGKLVPLAVASKARLPNLPNVPTFAEAGLPSVNDAAWVGLIAPAKIPVDVEKKIAIALTAALGQADVKAKFDLLLAQISANSSAEFQSALTAHIEKTRTLIKSANLKFE